jgi:hypothetical protein
MKGYLPSDTPKECRDQIMNLPQVDPSAALADSIAAARLRGDTTRADSLAGRTPVISVDPSAALQDSIAVARLRGANARADTLSGRFSTVPETPSYTFREGRDPITGKLGTFRLNTRTGEAIPVTSIAPVGNGASGDGYSEADRTRDLGIVGSGINPLNERQKTALIAPDSTIASEAYNADLERWSGAQYRLSADDMKKAITSLMAKFPPAQYKGQIKRHKATGILFFSDGTSWREVEKTEPPLVPNSYLPLQSQ